MRKKIILIILSILVVSGILIMMSLEPIKYKLKIKNYEKRLNNYYNLNKNSNFGGISDCEIDDYLSLPFTEFDVTKFINFYYKQITNKNDSKIDNLYDDAIGITMRGHDLSDFVDKENVDLNEVAKELEKVFIHKSDDIYKEWYLSADSNEKVDMPFGYYYTYEKSDYNKLDDIKAVKDFKFMEDIDFGKTKLYKCSMILELTDGTNKKIEHEIQYYDKAKDFSPYLKDIYYSGTHCANISLENHDIDKAVDDYWSRPDAY